MNLWKYSFELITRELDLTNKKEQALEELFASSKISKSTYDYLEAELKEAIADMETHLQSLKNKMNARAQELEKQIYTLELFLADLEIHHAAEEISDEAYENENKAILLGLETTKHELSEIKNSLTVTVEKKVEQPPEPEIMQAEETKETAQSEAPTLVSSSEQPTA
jgi:molecular chaperone GrpE (heat shock protein)